MKMRTLILIIVFVQVACSVSANPIKGLLERIDKGASKKFTIELVKGDKDFFELDQNGNKIVIRGNN